MLLFNNDIASKVTLASQSAGPRSFVEVVASDLSDLLHFQPEFHEALPTIWSSAYAFQKAVQSGEPSALNTLMAFFYLFWSDKLRWEPVDLDALDPELKLALVDTFPYSGKEPTPFGFFTSAGVIFGGYYPGTLFFPARDHHDWEKAAISAYVNNWMLDWDTCKNELKSDTDRQQFIGFCISLPLLNESKDRVKQFLAGAFAGQVNTAVSLREAQADPATWPKKTGPGQEGPTHPYPLRKGNTYFVLGSISSMPNNEHLSRLDGDTRLTLSEYVAENGQLTRITGSGTREVYTEHIQQGQTQATEPMKVITLSDLLLENSTCSPMDEMPDGRHRFFTYDDLGRQYIVLAPFIDEMLSYFPELADFPSTDAVSVVHEGDSFLWTISLFFPREGLAPYSLKFTWRTRKAETSVGLSRQSFYMWPPQVSPGWRLYFGIGTATKDGDHWVLLSSTGERAWTHKRQDNYWVNVLAPADGAPLTQRMYPSSLLLLSKNGTQKGLIFLDGEKRPDLISQEDTALSLDLGTSNTCLATYYQGQDHPEPIIFKSTLSPIKLWGAVQRDPRTNEKRSPDEIPGFIPFQWGGQRGFFPTMLLSVAGAEAHPEGITKLTVKDLIVGDIPSLHQGFEDMLCSGALQKMGWNVHDKLKWSTHSEDKWWRGLFAAHLLIYAHANLYFGSQRKVAKYIFTYPLALDEADAYLQDMKLITKKVREWTYVGVSPADSMFPNVDESTAIAAVAGKVFNLPASPDAVDVFLDIGGGTTEIAIGVNRKIYLLDSVRVAGGSFFRFTRENWAPEGRYRSGDFFRYLAQLLKDPKSGQSLALPQREEFSSPDRLDLPSYYSLQINRLDDEQFTNREVALLGSMKADNYTSFHQFRTSLFFLHLLAYALMEASAVLLDEDNALGPIRELRLILGGNSWGFLLFGKWERDESKLQIMANQIFQYIQDQVITDPSRLQDIRVSEVKLLHHQGSALNTKTAVAVGAIQSIHEGADSLERDARSKLPYACLPVSVFEDGTDEVRELRWNERWGAAHKGTMARRSATGLDASEGTQGTPNSNIIKTVKMAVKDIPDSAKVMIESLLRLGLGNTDLDPSMINGIKNGMVQNRLTIVTDPIKLTKRVFPPLSYFYSATLYPEDTHVILNKISEKKGRLLG
jgi:hypothetical protein